MIVNTLAKSNLQTFGQRGIEIRKMTVSLIVSMVRPGSGVKHMQKRPSWSEQVWEIYERVTGKKRPELFDMPKTEANSKARQDDPPV